jgi:hypothetical protein
MFDGKSTGTQASLLKALLAKRTLFLYFERPFPDN